MPLTLQSLTSCSAACVKITFPVITGSGFNWVLTDGFPTETSAEVRVKLFSIFFFFFFAEFTRDQDELRRAHKDLHG